MKFYICNHCGNIIAYVKSSGVPVVCCGEKMQELVPNTTDAAVEKHVPVIQIDGAKVTVTVGSAEHPMIPEHYVSRICNPYNFFLSLFGKLVYAIHLLLGGYPRSCKNSRFRSQ